MEKMLFLIRNQKDGKSLYVAAENLSRLVEIYSPVKIEQIVRVMVLRDKATHHLLESDIAKYIDSMEDNNFYLRFNSNEQEEDNEINILRYIKRLQQQMIDATISAKGNQSCFESKDAEIKDLKWILNTALEDLEGDNLRHESEPSWMDEARRALKQLES